MEKTRELFRNISQKYEHNKGQKWQDPTEAEEIKRTVGKNTQKTEGQYKKRHNDPGNHNGAVTHLELDLLQCEVNWALGSIPMDKASSDDKIPAEQFKNLKR